MATVDRTRFRCSAQAAGRIALICTLALIAGGVTLDAAGFRQPENIHLGTIVLDLGDDPLLDPLGFRFRLQLGPLEFELLVGYFGGGHISAACARRAGPA